MSMCRHRLGCVCAILSLICVPAWGWAQVNESSGPDPSAFTLDTPKYLAANYAARRPLMALLDHVGAAAPLDKLGLNIYGHVEGSYTYDKHPSEVSLINHRVNDLRLFDYGYDAARLDQVDLNIERRVDHTKPRFDIGFRTELMYGSDAGVLHSIGLTEYNKIFTPENQFDLTQAYLDIAVPLGNGVRIRLGKFVNFQGYETINPATAGIVGFFSRSYIFSWGLPFTYLGALGTYDPTPNVTLTAGAAKLGDTRDAALGNFDLIESNPLSQKLKESATGFLGSANLNVTDRFTVFCSAFVGPTSIDSSTLATLPIALPGAPLPPIVPGAVTDVNRIDNHGVRSIFDLNLYYSPTDRLTLGLNALYARQNGAVVSSSAQFFPPQSFDIRTHDTDWYGVAAYTAYQLNPIFTAKLRAEWFHDSNGFRSPIAPDIASRGTALTLSGPHADYYEVTGGLDIRPFANNPIGRNFLLRPEVRYDWGDARFFDNRTRRDQFTFQVDAVYSF